MKRKSMMMMVVLVAAGFLPAHASDTDTATTVTKVHVLRIYPPGADTTPFEVPGSLDVSYSDVFFVADDDGAGLCARRTEPALGSNCQVAPVDGSAVLSRVEPGQDQEDVPEPPDVPTPEVPSVRQLKAVVDKALDLVEIPTGPLDAIEKALEQLPQPADLIPEPGTVQASVPPRVGVSIAATLNANGGGAYASTIGSAYSPDIDCGDLRSDLRVTTDLSGFAGFPQGDTHYSHAQRTPQALSACDSREAWTTGDLFGTPAKWSSDHAVTVTNAEYRDASGAWRPALTLVSQGTVHCEYAVFAFWSGGSCNMQFIPSS